MREDAILTQIRKSFEEILESINSVKQSQEDRVRPLLVDLFKVMQKHDLKNCDYITALSALVVMSFQKEGASKKQAISYIESIFDMNESDSEEDCDDEDDDE